MASGDPASAYLTISARALLCLGFALIACRPAERPLISIGVNPWIGYEYLHLAVHKGFFAEEGVRVRLVEFGSINDSTRAFQRAEVDVLACSPVELLLTAAQSSRQVKVFHVMDFSNGADVVLARKPIADVAGLRGARVAVEPGTVTTFLLLRALESAGLTLDDVTMVPSDQFHMFDVFTAGEVDAVVTFPPVSSVLLATGQVNPLFDSKRVPGEIVDMLATDAAVLQARPHEVAAIIRGFERTAEFVETHPAEAHAFMAARMRMKPDEVAAVLATGIHITRLAEQEALLAAGGSLTTSLRLNAEILRRTGELSRDIDIGNLITTGPLRRALDASDATKRAPRPEP